MAAPLYGRTNLDYDTGLVRDIDTNDHGPVESNKTVQPIFLVEHGSGLSRMDDMKSCLDTTPSGFVRFCSTFADACPSAFSSRTEGLS